MTLEPDPARKVYRYGERRFLERAVTFGEFLLRPASEYKAMEGDLARFDEELRRVTGFLPGPLVAHFEGAEGPVDIHNVTWAREIDRDYYVLCFSTRWDVAHFEAFSGADACLQVVWRDAFFEVFHRAIELLFPDWVSLDAPVTYGALSPLGVPFSKPAHLEWQAEHRLVLVPPEPMELAQRVVRIGHLGPMVRLVDRPTP